MAMMIPPARPRRPAAMAVVLVLAALATAAPAEAGGSRGATARRTDEERPRPLQASEAKAAARRSLQEGAHAAVIAAREVARQAVRSNVAERITADKQSRK